MNKIEIYGKVDAKDALGDNNREEGKIKDAFCNKIIPLGNKTVETKDIKTKSNKHQFKFKFRYLSVKGIKQDWYFMHDGLKYEVDYWNPDFTNREFMEVFATLTQE